MKRFVRGAFVEYNANTSNSNVGDCVCRSISLALGKDYNEVRKGLNKEKRDRGYSDYGYPGVFVPYLRDTFDVEFAKFSGHTTVDEFCNSHKNGTYLLLVGSEDNYAKGISTHMACVIDGDLYDSWDSSDYIVRNYAVITTENTQFSGVTFDDILDDVISFLDGYIPKLQEKFKWGTIRLSNRAFESSSDGTPLGMVDNNTFKFLVYIDFPEIPELLKRKYRPGSTKIECTIKVNLKHDAKQNLDENISRIKSRIYQFVYKWNKEFTAADDAEFDPDTNSDFSGDYSLLKKMPQPMRKYIIDIHKKGNRLSLTMDTHNLKTWSGTKFPSYTWYAGSIDQLIEKVKDTYDGVDEFRYC